VPKEITYEFDLDIRIRRGESPVVVFNDSNAKKNIRHESERDGSQEK